jgi:hypothetical protein
MIDHNHEGEEPAMEVGTYINTMKSKKWARRRASQRLDMAFKRITRCLKLEHG